jgi:uroporphyrinogen III methyltransferase/synthase
VTGRAGAGTVHLVGAGPGDPGLLTVRGRELLAHCDAVVYDALANPTLLTLARREDGGAPELHDVGKRGGDTESARQEGINALLVRLAGEGKRVVRLKGGDPFVFGRGSEEAQALAAGTIPFEVVPGVTAGIAAPAYAGIPVTHRGLATSVTFVTGHEDPAKGAPGVDWGALARSGGTIVLYMGVKTLPRVAGALMTGGMPADTPAAAVEWGTCPRQRTVVATLATLADRAVAEGIGAPTIVVVGPVVALRGEIAWLEARPLFGRTVVVTRARAQASPLADRLRALGAEVLELPATRVEPADPAPLRAALRSLSAYAWAAFTSANAVRLTWDMLRAGGLDARAFAGVKLCAVGPATAEALLERGLAADLMPERFVAEGVLAALAERRDVSGARVLYVAAEGARDALPDGLRAMGATVDVVIAYRSVAERDGAAAAALRRALEAGEVDLVTYTSASGVRAFVDAVGSDGARRAPAAVIGPVTAAAARDAGAAVAVEASSSTIEGLVDAVAAHFAAARATAGSG